MVNNSINIIKTKDSLNSDGQQFHQYHQNKRKFKHQNKDSLISDGQQFHQYHQNKRKFKQ